MGEGTVVNAVELATVVDVLLSPPPEGGDGDDALGIGDGGDGGC